MDKTVESLVYTIRVGAGRVRSLSAQLEGASGKVAEALLTQLSRESEVLSSALQKVSAHTDALDDADAETARVEQAAAGDWWPVVLRLNQLTDTGTCPTCGGVNWREYPVAT